LSDLRRRLERVKIGGDRKGDRSGPIKYNYFPIEWKLFGNELSSY